MKDLIILGAGGAGWDIVSLVHSLGDNNGWNILGFLDDNTLLFGKECCGIKVLGNIDDCCKYSDAYFISSIANPTNRIVRKSVWDRVKRHGLRFATLIHPSVILYDNVVIEEGCVINANCVLGTNSHLCKDVHLGYSCNVAHETKIFEHTSMGAAVNLSSGVTIGANCYIGAGVSSTHDVEVEDDTLVAVGSAIVTNMRHKTERMWIGVPAITQEKYQDVLSARKYAIKQINNKK